MQKIDLQAIEQEVAVDMFPQEDLFIKRLKFLTGSCNKKKTVLPSVIPALPTLYLTNGAINLTALEEFMQAQAAQGIKAVLVAGTTGESSFMNINEQLYYIDMAVKIAENFNLQVVAGVGANSTTEQSVLAKGAFKLGADASLLLPPYYIKSSPQGILQHLWEGLNKGPGILYSISGRTGVEIPLEVIKELSQHPYFLGVKECDGQKRIKQLTDWGIQVWSGNDDTLPDDRNKYGAFGAITVVGDIDPVLVQTIVEGRAVFQDVVRQITLSKILFPPGMPNPIAIHNASEMIRRQKKDIQYPVTFRDVVLPFTEKAQLWMQKSLGELGIPAEVFRKNHQLYNDITNVPPKYRTPDFEYKNHLGVFQEK